MTILGFVADALWQIKLGDYKAAAALLGSHLEDKGLNPMSRVSLMEWTADCYFNCDEHGQAAKWFETAGMTVLDCPGVSTLEKKRKATVFFERALDCHRVNNDIQGIKRAASLKYNVASSHERDRPI